MKAIVIEKPGDETSMKLGDAEPPVLRPGAIRIQVAGAGVNRADLLQRRGFYPPPPGASPILGLECAGEVTEVGDAVSDWELGDRVMALLAGGGYAEQVVVDAGSVMRVPADLSLVEAAALPEVFLTVFLNVFQLGGLGEGDLVLVHGGGSGIGTATIQLARAAGARCIVTAGSDEKCRRCLDLGAEVAVNYQSGDFVEAVREASGGDGARVVLDSIGAPYLEKNLQCLALDGRLVVIGLMGGARAELDLGALLTRRLQVIGSTLRARSDAQKAALVSAFVSRFGADLLAGRLQPVVDRVLEIGAAPEAHRVMQASEHFGKIVLQLA